IHTIDAVIVPAKNIVETAVATTDLSILVDVLTKFDDLVATLSDETGEFTVFAPTNAAFAALLSVIGQTSADNIPEDVLRSVLEYHVIAANKINSTNLADGISVTTVNGEDITVTEVGGSFLISGVGINTADVMTSNGVVHIMDGVLVPPSIAQFVNTIVEPAYFNKDFTTLIAAVKAADPSILATLLGDGPSGNGMTLFAPTNDAFAAAGITELPDQATLNAVLAYHLIDGVVMSTGLPSTTVAAPAAITTVGGDFYLTNKGTGVYINGNTMVTATDIDPSEGAGTANGVVHVIDRTLVPPSQDIVAIAIEAGFSELAAALTEAGLVSTLQGAGPFTVFAPTDAAFDALYTALGATNGASDVDDALLEAVLLYHVLGLRAFSSDLEDGLEATTLSSGETFTVNLSDGASITDGSGATANIISVNVLGTNGVIHVIDKVILPH
ncbi:MAG: fasciclin domain-containing protein, partial [Bacteroidales bacterium]|nr:fasciclin domain-containing protein [Bacteroidales bacterium]